MYRIEGDPQAKVDQILLLFQKNPGAAVRHPMAPYDLLWGYPHLHKDIRANPILPLLSLEDPVRYHDLDLRLRSCEVTDRMTALLKAPPKNRKEGRRRLAWAAEMVGEIANGKRLNRYVPVAKYSYQRHLVLNTDHDKFFRALAQTRKYALRAALGMKAPKKEWLTLWYACLRVHDTKEEFPKHTATELLSHVTMLGSLLSCAGELRGYLKAPEQGLPYGPTNRQAIALMGAFGWLWSLSLDTVGGRTTRASESATLTLERREKRLHEYLNGQVEWYEKACVTQKGR